MIIGDRLRDLREGKNSPRVTSKSVRACFAVTFLESRMATPVPAIETLEE
jgi:hypothetical protein